MGRRPLLVVLTLFAGGILCGHMLAPAAAGMIPILVLGLALLLVACLWVPRRAKTIVLLSLFFVAGAILDLMDHLGGIDREELPAGARVILQGTVLEAPWASSGTCSVRVHDLWLQGTHRRLNHKVRVRIFREPPTLAPGDLIRFPARLRPFRRSLNPGSPDIPSIMTRRGFACSASISDGRSIVPMGRGSLPLFQEYLERIRAPFRETLSRKLDPPAPALVAALLLGEKAGVPPRLRDLFNRCGLGHILAISGLHVGLVAWLCFFLLDRCLSFSYGLQLHFDRRRLAAAMTCVPVIAYTALAGFQLPAQRAMIMVLAFLGSIMLGRPRETWSTLALAALVILALDPHAPMGISFQLSFLAVAGIVWLTPSLVRFLVPHKALASGRFSLWAYLGGLAAATLAATAVLAPLMAFYFHQISLIGIAANLFAVPLLGLWILPTGLLAAGTHLISPEAAAFALQLSTVGLDLLLALVRWAGSQPWAAVWVVTPNLFEIALLYAILVCLCFMRHSRWACWGLPVVLALLLCDTAYWTQRLHFSRDFRVTFFDVGQGNAALVEFPGGKKMLIDGGGDPYGRFDVGRRVLAPALWAMKIRRVHILVSTHLQADHTDGLIFVAQHFRPAEFWYNGEVSDRPAIQILQRILAAGGVSVLSPATLPPERQIGEIRIQVLHPSKADQFAASSSSNDRSLVLRLIAPPVTFLFPGDLEREGERSLLAYNRGRLKSQVLLVPHHGSRNACSYRFLEHVQPRTAVISAGCGNPFGFPHPETLERLRRMGCRIVRIDKSGAVQMRVSGGRLHMKCTGGDYAPF